MTEYIGRLAQRRKDLFWFMVLEGSINHTKEVMVARTQREEHRKGAGTRCPQDSPVTYFLQLGFTS